MKEAPLPREEWDFSSCPEAERAACLHYEYAREYVQTQPELLAKLVGKPRPAPYHHPLVFVYSKKVHPDSLPMLCTQFPAAPWLKLPATTRHDLIAQCQLEPEKDAANSNLLVEDGFDVLQLQELDERRKELFAQWMQDNREQHDREISGLHLGLRFEEQPIERPELCFGPKRYYAVSDEEALAVIRLDWRWSDRQLKAAFERLIKRRPKPSKQNEDATRQQVSGRGGASDQLNQLGAKRLLRHCGNRENAVEAIDAVPMPPGQKQPYTDADALSAAAAKAGIVLQAMIDENRFRAFADLV